MKFSPGILALSAVCGLAMISCRGNAERMSPTADVSLAPLHEIVYDISGADSASARLLADSCIRNYPAETSALMAVVGYDSLSAEALMEFASTPAVKIFSPPTDSLAPDTRSVGDMLSYAVNAAAAEGLDLGNHSYATVVWGKLRSVIFCDSVVLIALNHYLGENYPGYKAMESYLRKTKTPASLPYDLAESLVATAMPYRPTDNSATINRLIYEGVMTEAKMRFVENANPALALGYTDEEYSALLANEKWIWDKMVSSGMLFDHDPSVVSKLISPAPSSTLISQSCPGRAGRFVGYKIVRAYLDGYPDAKLSDMLSPEFYNLANPLTVMTYRP